MLFVSPLQIGSAVAITGTIFEMIRRSHGIIERRNERKKQEIIKIARFEANEVRRSCEEKLKDLEIQLQIQKDNVAKDLVHLKETYNAEIKVLGEKIETLREDLSNQHQNLVALLTKLIDSN